MNIKLELFQEVRPQKLPSCPWILFDLSIGDRVWRACDHRMYEDGGIAMYSGRRGVTSRYDSVCGNLLEIVCMPWPIPLAQIAENLTRHEARI
jgi:hypothetical protein